MGVDEFHGHDFVQKTLFCKHLYKSLQKYFFIKITRYYRGLRYISRPNVRKWPLNLFDKYNRNIIFWGERERGEGDAADVSKLAREDWLPSQIRPTRYRVKCES